MRAGRADLRNLLRRERRHAGRRRREAVELSPDGGNNLGRDDDPSLPLLLAEAVARLAKRGRKRWLGLAFVTQLPAHLPRQVFGLCNSYILHKSTDAQVVQMLRKTVSGIDDGLWDRLPGLAPGQAIVSFPHLTRTLLVAVDPTPAKLRLTD